MIVQCVNSIPRFKDKGGALYRRLLPIPFEKCFTGVEKRYIKDDYLKRPEVLEYVLWKVLNMDFNEFSEPAACLALLNEYKEYNNPIRQFAEEILPQCAWDLLPFTFLYDLYKSWFERNCPSGRTVDHKVFINELADVLRDYPEWICDRSKEYRRKKLMDSPEPLISAYCLDGWYNKGYHGSDAAKIFTPTLRDKYRGLIRASVVASADNDNGSDDNDDNDQCEDMDKVFTAYTSTPKDLSLAG